MAPVAVQSVVSGRVILTVLLPGGSTQSNLHRQIIVSTLPFQHCLSTKLKPR